jgi:hypothetical protein
MIKRFDGMSKDIPRLSHGSTQRPVWMLHNLSKSQVNLLPKVRRLNPTTQMRQFFLSQATQIPLDLPNLTKHNQYPNTCLIKCGMLKVRL